MQIKYTDLDIHFSLEHSTFTVLNLVYERFLRSIPKHSHSNHSYEIHYIPRGYGKAVINGQSYQLVPNTLYITGPGVEHEQIPELSNPMEEYCIYLKTNSRKKEVISSPADQIVLLFKSTPFWYGQDQEHIGALMEQLFYEMENQTLGYRLQVEALLQQCIIQIVRNYLAITNKSRYQLDTPFESSNLFDQKYIVLEECFLYEYQDITLASLSKRLGLSPRQTERLLKEHYGKTFLQKRNDAKMSAASILLTTTNKSITAIAMELGYSAVEHFSNSFKRYYHISARELRKQNL